jgi:nucleoside phosphorylase
MKSATDTELGTVVICTAVDDEYRAVREHLAGPLRELEKEGSLYQVGTFATERGTWTVALVQTGAGNTPAAVQLERAIGEFGPEVVFFVGVAGGVKDLGLGDVVAANAVYDYESGKDTAAEFLPRIKTGQSTYRLVERARQIARDDEWQHRILPAPPAPQPTALVSPIAAGSKVVADQRSPTAELLRKHCSDAAAVEMEGHGFLYTAHVNEDVAALVVRGISDLLSGKTAEADKQWQPIASRHAAAFTFELLSRLPQADTRREAVRQRDRAAVREVTESNLNALDDVATLPGIEVPFTFDRAEIPTLLEVDGTFVLTGEPGCGKTGVLNRLAHEMIAHGDDVVLLTVDTIGAEPGAIRDDVPLSQSLLAVLGEWEGESRATVLVDGLDATRGGPLPWLVRLIEGLTSSRWRVIATVRRFDLRNSPTWSRVFSGPPVSQQQEHLDGTLAGVRHFVLGNLSADELTAVAKTHPGVAQLQSGASEHMLDLIRNPFNLRLACELLSAGVSQASLAEARDQLELLHQYWNLRVMPGDDREARQRTLECLTATMLERRALRASSRCIPHALLDARTALLRDGVIHELPSRLKAGGSQSLAYSHHILFDYSVAALIFTADDESQLVPRLRDDPNLVLVARPSIDLHLADLWHVDQDRAAFATVATALAQHGDSLAGVAAVRVLASEAETDHDVRWLIDLSRSGAKTSSTIIGWLVGVLDADDEGIRERARGKIGLWTKVLAGATAQAVAGFDIAMVNQAYRLLKQIDKLSPMHPGTVAALVWAECVAGLMSCALEAPAERERLGTEVGRFLPRAVAIVRTHGQVLRETLKPEIVDLWPPRYLEHYVDAVSMIASGDPDLARDLLVLVLRRSDDRDDVTPLFQGIMTMTSTYRKDLEMAKYTIGTQMGSFIAAAGIPRAIEVLAEALGQDSNELGKQVDGYPILVPSARGHVDFFGHHLEYGPGHGAAKAILTAVTTALLESPTENAEFDTVVVALVQRIRHPEAWQALLATAGARPADLGHAFLPVLASGGLIAHSRTRAAAGKLIRAISPSISEAEQHDLEQAILAAPTLFRHPSDEAADEVIGQLCGCLDIEKIQDAALAERARRQTDADGPPLIPEHHGPHATVSPLTLEDYLGDQNAELTDLDQREALDALRQLVDALPPNPSSDQMAALEQALRRALAAGIGGPEHHGPGSELIFRAIGAIVRAQPPEPDSDLAELVVPLLLAAASTDDPLHEEGPAS